MNSIYGIKIIENPCMSATKPKMTLSDKVTVTTEFREKQNKWLLEFFGEEALIWVMGGNYVMHPAVAAEFRRVNSV